MSRRGCLALLIVGFAALAPAPAAAVAPPFQRTATTAQAARPAPQSGRASIDLHGGLSTRRLRYVYRGQSVVVTGAVRPFVPGQTVLVEVLRHGKVVSRQRAAIR